MKLHQLKSKTKRITKTRIARGIAGKGGKTGGRGTKGQKARTGFNLPKRFEGGQSPLIQRSPKIKGFLGKPNKPIAFSCATLERIFADGATISPEVLAKKGLIKSAKQKVKIIGVKKNTKTTKTFKFENCLTSKSIKA